MMGGFQSGGSYHEPEWYIKEQELNELSEQTGLSDQELSRLKSTTAQRGLYIVVGIALLLFLIVMIVGANVFHWS